MTDDDAGRGGKKWRCLIDFIYDRPLRGTAARHFAISYCTFSDAFDFVC